MQTLRIRSISVHHPGPTLQQLFTRLHEGGEKFVGSIKVEEIDSEIGANFIFAEPLGNGNFKFRALPHVGVAAGSVHGNFSFEEGEGGWLRM